jgi:hypothetical protein
MATPTIARLIDLVREQEHRDSLERLRLAHLAWLEAEEKASVIEAEIQEAK